MGPDEIKPETGDDIQGETPTAAGSETPTKPQTPLPTIEELMAQLKSAEARISELNQENAGRRKSLEAFEAAEKIREEEALSAQEKLSKREAELAETTATLTGATEQLRAFETILEEQYQATIKTLNVPNLVQDAIKDKPLAERLQFINAHRDEFSQARGIDLAGRKDGRSEKKFGSLQDLKGMSADQINANWDALLKSQNK